MRRALSFPTESQVLKRSCRGRIACRGFRDAPGSSQTTASQNREGQRVSPLAGELRVATRFFLVPQSVGGG